MKRGNLRVITHALVHKINFEGRRATGVTYRIGDGPLQQAGARSEVLLCAGAIQSPQLLMLSGLGPAEHLRQQGIAVLADLPGVGANLQDHCLVPMSWRLRPGVASMNQDFRGLGLLRSVLRYALLRRGPMTSPPSELCGYARSDPTLPYNDIQFFGLPVTGEPTLNKGKAPKPDGFAGMTFGPCQVRPFSRGSIQLRAPDAAVHPLIRMNYLHDERDRHALLWALRLMRRIAGQAALADQVESEFRPGPQVQTDQQWLDWLAPHLTTAYHPVGSCRIGHADDPMAVVTPDLKLRHVEGLRVIDASVMPNLICGNTNATAVAIGDKGADLVLGRAALAPIDD